MKRYAKIVNGKIELSRSTEGGFSEFDVGTDPKIVGESGCTGNWSIDGSIPVPPTVESTQAKELSLDRSEAWDKVKALRAKEIVSNLEHIGYYFQMDRYSTESMQEAIAELVSGEEISWRSVENSTVELSSIQLGNILTKYRQRKLLLSKASWMVEAVILGSPAPQDLDVEALYETYIDQLEGA